MKQGSGSNPSTPGPQRTMIDEWLSHGDIIATIITDKRLTGRWVKHGEDIYPKVGRSIQRPDGSWATLIVQFPEP